ncbi:hypothetical protein [Pedococcus bigeumensis]|uniref:hypothetical protein n=1 Tax=Pedococcus bigeumensis TaxID=433644 RepID=UPI002FE8D7C6
MSQAVELLNRGLDVFALRGLGAASLDGTGGIRIAYWESAQEKCVRLWARMDAALFTSGTAVVRAPDGSIKEEPEPTVLAWQESMRYYRMSQVTDDLFDAFRNVYLALESILSAIEPIKVGARGRAAESEETWFKRALASVADSVALDTYSAGGSGNAVHDIYDELHNRVRNRVFHAKDGLGALLPQSLESRVQVGEAKKRYSELYLEVASKQLNTPLGSGSTRLSESAMDEMREGILSRGPNLGFTSDTTPFDSADTELSPRGDPCVIVPVQAIDDPQASEGYAAVIGRTSVHEHASSVTTIGRFGLLGARATPG